jgi:hypothetical protein
MTIDQFQTEFPFIATCMAIGFCTTVEWKGKVYSFRKVKCGQFERVV